MRNSPQLDDTQKIGLRRPLALLLFLSILSVGMVGALSVVPHVHGDDFDHSKHASCPIHQLGQHGFQAVIDGFGTAIAISFAFYLLVFIDLPVISLPTRFFSVRAPPVAL
jgi:hypothetical protein